MEVIKQKIQKSIYQVAKFFERQKAFYIKKQNISSGVLQMGIQSYGNPRIDSYKGSESKVIIGNYCSISKNVVMVTGGDHPQGWVSTYPFRIRLGLPGAYCDGMPMTKGKIVIGSDVWIGTDVMILSGVTIGHGAIVAAGSVVTKDIQPYAIAAGIPAKVIKYRFNEKQILALLRIKWWEWSEDMIKEVVSLLSSPDIDQFIDAHKQ
jgi:acetyltransferase-like isoleucine patch superfamily enzyme